jgi:hypothetical protein
MKEGRKKQVNDIGKTAEDAEYTSKQMEDESSEIKNMPTDKIEDEAEKIPNEIQLDLSILDGLEVQEGGKIFDSGGNMIGEVARATLKILSVKLLMPRER